MDPSRGAAVEVGGMSLVGLDSAAIPRRASLQARAGGSVKHQLGGHGAQISHLVQCSAISCLVHGILDGIINIKD